MTSRALTDGDIDAVLLGSGTLDPDLADLAAAVRLVRDDLTPAWVHPSAELATWLDGTAAVPPTTAATRPTPVVPLFSRMAVQVVAGATVVVAALGGAAAAGVLPGPVQHLYDGLVHRLGRGETGPAGDARSGPRATRVTQPAEPAQTISHHAHPGAAGKAPAATGNASGTGTTAKADETETDQTRPRRSRRDDDAVEPSPGPLSEEPDEVDEPDEPEDEPTDGAAGEPADD